MTSTLPYVPIVELELWQLDLRHAALRIRDAETVARLAVSLERHGQLAPVLVIQSGETLILVDGFVRLAAMRRRSADTVRALVLPLSETEALTWCYRQRRGRRPTPLEEGWLVEALHVHQGQPLTAIAVGLERSTSWASRRLGLVRELPDAIQQSVRRGTLSAYIAMRSLLPLARANAATAVRIADVVQTEKLTTRQVARLCAGFRAADPAQREQLLDRPRAYLRLDEHVSQQRCEQQSKPSLVQDFEKIAAIARRCTRVLCDPQRRETGAVEALLVTWPRVCSAFRELTQAVEEQRHAQA